ncbi:MAG: methyltransferase domain-containing protein [Elusimicrobia bacterium]|nr:methyltransferase domain-containing protein [Elusimicrobiota bacterium]
MRRKKCRVCSGPLPGKPLLRYGGMPAQAQYLPARRGLARGKGAYLDVFQCSGCGLVQLGGGPVPYYREVIRAAAFSPEMEAFRRKQFSSFVRKYGLKGKKIVELGCGRGEYLRLMLEAGTEASGLEYSKEAALDCARAGLKVSRGFLGRADMKLPGAPFDAFFILNFLEHLPDPNALLAGMRANLGPGGVGLVEVPDFGMMLRRNLFSEFIPDHLCYFTRETLGFLLNLNGFELLESGTVWHGYVLSAVVRKREPLDLSGFTAAGSALKSSLLGFLSGFRPGRVAVWGAGHQALAVLALAGLGGKIKYVVDSAPFKQGKFTPATHVPIVPASRLDSDPVDAVIIMAASYSDEVRGFLRKKYAGRIKLAVLRGSGLEVL